MSLSLSNPSFWSQAATSYGLLLQDGSLKYILLDQTFKMQPLVRNVKTTFTQFLAADLRARACKVIVNGNFYDLTTGGKISVFMNNPDSPEETIIEGQVIENGKLIAGDSRPESFWFGQLMIPSSDAWYWACSAGKGDPPLQVRTMAAVGGVGPLIISNLPYGVGNRYKPGAPSGTPEPSSGEPPPAARDYMIQRNNATFIDVNRRPPETGKTILAYCFAKRTILVAVQEDGAGPGQTHSAITTALAQQGFDTAVFLDGSDSATLVIDGTVVISPGERKNRTIDVGIGFHV